MEVKTDVSPDTLLPELECYLSTLVVTTMLRYKMVDLALECSNSQIKRMLTFNRRSLDTFMYVRRVFLYVILNVL